MRVKERESARGMDRERGEHFCVVFILRSGGAENSVGFMRAACKNTLVPNFSPRGESLKFHFFHIAS